MCFIAFGRSARGDPLAVQYLLFSIALHFTVRRCTTLVGTALLGRQYTRNTGRALPSGSQCTALVGRELLPGRQCTTSVGKTLVSGEGIRVGYTRRKKKNLPSKLEMM
jgi:ribosomal protein L33